MLDDTKRPPLPGFVLTASHRVEPTQGIAFSMEAGHAIRLIEVDGPQVIDCAVATSSDSIPGRPLHIGQSIVLNLFEGIGGPRALRRLYTSPPDEQVLGNVIEDTSPDHCAWLGSRCSRSTHRRKAREGLISETMAESGPNCQDTIDAAFASIGVVGPYRGDVLNLFMRIDEAAAFRNERLSFLHPTAQVGDRWTLRAAMRIHIALSACPNEDSPLNGGRAKAFLAERWSPDDEPAPGRSTNA